MHLVFKANIQSAPLNTLIDNFLIRHTLVVPNRMASQCVYICAGFKVGRVQTCDSADLGVCLISCCLSRPVCSLSSVPDTNEVFSSTQLLLLLFGSFSENPRGGCVAETPADQQQFSDRQPVWHQEPRSKSLQIPFIAHFDARFELQQVAFTTTTSKMH